MIRDFTKGEDKIWRWLGSSLCGHGSQGGGVRPDRDRIGEGRDRSRATGRWREQTRKTSLFDCQCAADVPVEALC